MGHIYVCDKCGKQGEDILLNYVHIRISHADSIIVELCTSCTDKFNEMAKAWVNGDNA